MTKIVFVLVDILPHLKGIPPSHGQIGMSVEYCQRLVLTWRDLSYCRRTSCWAPRCPLVDWRRWRPSGTRLAHLHVCGGRNTPVMSSFKYHIRVRASLLTTNRGWWVGSSSIKSWVVQSSRRTSSTISLASFSTWIESKVWLNILISLKGEPSLKWRSSSWICWIGISLKSQVDFFQFDKLLRSQTSWMLIGKLPTYDVCCLDNNTHSRILTETWYCEFSK